MAETPTESAVGRRLRKRFEQLASGVASAHVLRDYGIFLFGLVLFIALSIGAPHFLTVSNLVETLREVSITGIGAVGMAIVIITGGIDVSVGSVLVFGSIAAALPLRAGWPLALCIPLGFFSGLLVGWINGILITRVGISPIITTLGTMTIVSGASFLITGGMTVFQIPQAISFLGRGFLGPLPFPVILLFAVYILAYFYLEWTVSGRYIFAVGGNEEATRLSGINTRRIKVIAYVICGGTAAVAGLIILGRLVAAELSGGSSYPFDVITAVALGGVSLSGGKGNIWKVLLGAVILGMLADGFVLLDVQEYWRMVMTGVVLLLAVASDIAMEKTRI